ncbi:hypothetical protein ACU686_44765 [Yinghuangia aomiensis]
MDSIIVDTHAAAAFAGVSPVTDPLVDQARQAAHSTAAQSARRLIDLRDVDRIVNGPDTPQTEAA